MRCGQHGRATLSHRPSFLWHLLWSPLPQAAPCLIWQVVFGFLIPPDAGLHGRPLQSLFAFERVHVPAGSSVTVWLAPKLTDFAFVDESGERKAVAGKYVARFGVRETATRGGGFLESVPFLATAGVIGKALYFILIDRFARAGAARANTTGCGGNVWCGGSLAGIVDRLDYVQGMGFECVYTYVGALAPRTLAPKLIAAGEIAVPPEALSDDIAPVSPEALSDSVGMVAPTSSRLPALSAADLWATLEHHCARACARTECTSPR
jgi:hypothetical protein